MKKKSVLIAVLIVIALVLGVMIYQGTSVSTPGEVPPPAPPASQAPRDKIPQSVTSPEERAALTPLPDKASKDEQFRYWQLLNSLAQDTKSVELRSECVMEPLVVRMQRGGTLRFQNNDAIAHTIFIDTDSWAIPIGKTVEVTPSFPHGKGFYITVCFDQGANNEPLPESDKFVGVLFVE